MLQSKFDISRIISNKKRIFKKFFALDEYSLEIPLYKGGMSRHFTREVFERGKAVAAILYDPKRDELLFIEQFRAGAYAAGVYPWLLEIVAGMMDHEGENPEEVVRREVLEECGCYTKRIMHILDFMPTPGGCSEEIKLYYAEIDITERKDIAGLDAENEDIKVIALKREEALKLLDSGRLNNGAVLIAMQWFALNQNKIINQWNNK